MVEYFQMVGDLGLNNDDEDVDLSDVSTEKLDKLITYVNSNDLGWTANQCLHSKSKCGNSVAQKNESNPHKFGEGQ